MNSEEEQIIQDQNSAFDTDEEKHVEVSLFLRVLRGSVALIVLLGLLYISGIYQSFLYRRTPTSLNQASVESRVDAQTIFIPLTIFIITGSEPYGTTRSEENAVHLVENASRIWDQAGVALVIKNIYTVAKSDEEMKIFYEAPSTFVQTIDEFDEATINVFLVGSLGGINGIAFGGLRSVAVAEYTTVYDFRTLAHEVGHIVGLQHVPELRGRLMYRGANGFELSLNEIERARLNAQDFESE